MKAGWLLDTIALTNDTQDALVPIAGAAKKDAGLRVGRSSRRVNECGLIVCVMGGAMELDRPPLGSGYHLSARTVLKTP